VFNLILFCGWHKVVSFDGSTTVSEFLVALEKSIGVRESSLSGFALFSDDPAVAGIEYCLQADAKVPSYQDIICLDSDVFFLTVCAKHCHQ